jgi:hypothetical protein
MLLRPLQAVNAGALSPCHPERRSVGRTLLSAAFDLAFGQSKLTRGFCTDQARIQNKTHIKGGGQECPPHTVLNDYFPEYRSRSTVCRLVIGT